MTNQMFSGDIQNGASATLINLSNAPHQVALANGKSEVSIGVSDQEYVGPQGSSFQMMIDEWKRLSIQPNLKVEFAKDEPTNSIWMNLVDNATGQVVLKFPPEAVRLLKQHSQASGLVADFRT
ncbi:flagellar protein FlaG [Alicyclobacillus dauci]|uniref:Flagellar protein FlaG n=1 Tax=Alicyclobacillus dauci TaxID=1475485 RepID=A0ABY6Z679_9BACL|nr:flagellar protein FlaG [Alicyclobacillus dauci]WAH37691.1 flagellar protein FlaG [Alicyclobacillus dauci]